MEALAPLGGGDGELGPCARWRRYGLFDATRDVVEGPSFDEPLDGIDGKRVVDTPKHVLARIGKEFWSDVVATLYEGPGDLDGDGQPEITKWCGRAPGGGGGGHRRGGEYGGEVAPWEWRVRGAQV